MNTPKWVVTDVMAKDDYTLHLTFAGGEKKVYDMTPMLGKKVCEPLNDKDFFMTAKVDCGTVIWNDDIDIAPEHLYENSVSIDTSEKDQT